MISSPLLAAGSSPSAGDEQDQLHDGSSCISPRSHRWSLGLCIAIAAVTTLAYLSPSTFTQTAPSVPMNPGGGGSMMLVGKPQTAPSVPMNPGGGGSMMLVGKSQTASSVQTSSVTERIPTTADSIAMVSGMDTLIGHQVHAFDQDLWEKTMSLSFAWDFTYWYSFPDGSEAWQFTENPYTDRTPSNWFDLEMLSDREWQAEEQTSLKHWDPALATSLSRMELGQRLNADPDTGDKDDVEIADSFDASKAINVAIHHDNGVYGSIDQWFYGEHIPWNVAFPNAKFSSTVGFIFAGSGPKVTCLAYAQAWFEQPFKGIPNVPTKEFAIFLERETHEGVKGARRNYWLSKFEHIKYGLTVDAELTASHTRLEPEPRGFMQRDPKGVMSGEQPFGASGAKLTEQLAIASGLEDSEYKALIKTLQSRVEPGEASRTVLPFMLTIVDLDFYHVGYLNPDSASDPMLRILYNMCMGDLNMILVQTGRRYLHSAVPYSSHQPFVNRLREGSWENPRSMSGDTLPQTAFVDERQTRRNDALFVEYANAILGLTNGEETTSKAASDTWRTLHDTHFTKDGLFYGNPYTLGRASNSQDVYDLLNGVFGGNFTKRRLEFVDHKGDDFDTVICQGPVCAMSGFLVGSINKGDTWLGINNAQDDITEVRHHFALFLNLHDIMSMEGVLVTTKIRDAYLLVDLPGSAMQLGFDMIKLAQQTP